MLASLPFEAALLFSALLLCFYALLLSFMPKSVGHHAGLLPCGIRAYINVSIHVSPEALPCTQSTMLSESKTLATSGAWRPERTRCGRPTISSPTTWWRWPRSSPHSSPREEGQEKVQVERSPEHHTAGKQVLWPLVLVQYLSLQCCGAGGLRQDLKGRPYKTVFYWHLCQVSLNSY